MHQFENKPYVNIIFNDVGNERERLIRFYYSIINPHFKTLSESAINLLIDYAIKYASEVDYPKYQIVFDETLLDLQNLLIETNFLINNNNGTFSLAYTLRKQVKQIHLSWS